MGGGTIFDNIVIADSTAEADEFAAKWKVLSEVEQAEKKKADDASAASFEKARAARAAKDAAKKAAEKKDEDDDDDDEDDKDTQAKKIPDELRLELLRFRLS